MLLAHAVAQFSFSFQCYEIAPSIVEVIAGGVDPDFVCEKLGVCKGRRQPV